MNRLEFQAFVKELRLVAVDLSMDKVTEIIDKVRASCVEFDKKDFNCYLRDKELYAYLLKRLNKKLKAITANTKRGFGVFRRILREVEV